MQTNRTIISPYDVLVDRTSVLGNPYHMSKECCRDEVCDMYEDWFENKLNIKAHRIMDELNRFLALHKKYGKLRIFCWCAPKRCHAETIKMYLESKL